MAVERLAQRQAETPQREANRSALEREVALARERDPRGAHVRIQVPHYCPGCGLRLVQQPLPDGVEISFETLADL